VSSYPNWTYYPTRDPAPAWVEELVDEVAQVRANIDSAKVEGLTSDRVLAFLRPGLEERGFRIEAGKRKADRITLPVLFGEQGLPRVRYDVDGVHEGHGVLLEVEAGRGARGNAIYRDLIRTSLIVNARFLALGVMREYHHKSGGRPIVVRSYEEAKDQIDAIYASQRLQLPFEGVLLFGY
jgi:hypothetical protein